MTQSDPIICLFNAVDIEDREYLVRFVSGFFGAHWVIATFIRHAFVGMEPWVRTWNRNFDKRSDALAYARGRLGRMMKKGYKVDPKNTNQVLYQEVMNAGKK